MRKWADRYRSWWVTALIVLGSFLFSLLISNTTPVRNVASSVVDILYEIRGPVSEESEVVLVTIDQTSYDAIPYAYPWPRNLYAKLVENLNSAGARAIGFDIIFDSPDRYDPANDSLFSSTIRESGNVFLAGNIEAVQKGLGTDMESVTTTLLQPNEVLMTGNENRMGLVKSITDRDGSIRRYVLHMDWRNERYYSMALRLLETLNPDDAPPVATDNHLLYSGYRIPLQDPMTMNINFFDSPGNFPSYSFADVVDDEEVMLREEDADFQTNTFSDPEYGLINSELFRDKIVLVGSTIPAQQDFHATPFARNGNRPGIEIHASALQTILTGRFIRYSSVPVNLALVLLSALLIVLITRRARGFWPIGVLILIGTGMAAAAIYLFLEERYVLEVITPMMALLFGYSATETHKYVTEYREKNKIRSIFSSYVSPAVVRQIVESGKEPQLGGDMVHMTAFFSDIVAFSSFSEELDADELVTLMNEYFTAMTDILIEESGTLDKYIGDAMVAFFGAPLELPDHALKACIVSQRMHLKLGELRQKWKSHGDRWPEVVHNMRMRIGINTGIMLTGNIGSNQRFNYTMMGDQVNVAARCESGAKQFGVYTMVTGETKEAALEAGDDCVFRYLDRIVVKGRTHPIEVYEVMGLKGKLDSDSLACRKMFEAGVEAYRNRQWDEAMGWFSRSAVLEPARRESDTSTTPSVVYLERCREMNAQPPPSDWNGVYVMEEK